MAVHSSNIFNYQKKTDPHSQIFDINPNLAIRWPGLGEIDYIHILWHEGIVFKQYTYLKLYFFKRVEAYNCLTCVIQYAIYLVARLRKV